MGKAAAELPDPGTVAPAGAGGADALLAQLAGDEIDRLLADAGEDAAEAPVAVAPPVVVVEEPAVVAVAKDDAVAAVVAPSAIDGELDALFDTLTEKPAAAPEGEVKIDGELDSLFESLTGTPAESVEPEVAAAAASAVAAVDEAVAAAPAAVVEEEEDAAASLMEEARAAVVEEAVGAALKSEAWRDAAPVAPGPLVIAPGAAPAAAVGPGRATGVPFVSASDAPTGVIAEADVAAAFEAVTELEPHWVLRPLMWINRPFENLSDVVRERIGLVALVTLGNAAALLIYVGFFRKP